MPRQIPLAALCWLINVTASNAAVIHVTPRATAFLNVDFSSTDPWNVVSNDPFHPVLRPRDEDYVVQFDVSVRIDDLQPGQGGFGNVAFDITPRANFRMNRYGVGWEPDTSDLNCSGCPRTPIWADNGDFGASGSDLQDILLGIAPRELGPIGVDPRRTLGQSPEGTFANSIFFELPGRYPFGRLKLVATGGSVYDDHLLLTTAGTTALGGDVVISAVSEPSSSWTALSSALASLALYATRFRPAFRDILK